MKAAANRKSGDRQKHALGKVLIGLCIALPLLVLVISLLASADGVFDHFLSEVPNLLDGLSFGDYAARGLWSCFFCFAFFGYLWGFVEPQRYAWEKGAGDGTAEQTNPKIDPIVIATVLIAVNAVYVLFVIVQFSYLFGAWEGFLPEGKSYAEYARRGFFELVAVTVINFGILVGTLTLGGKGGAVLRRMNASMLYILVACSAVMLYSAFTRLVLYEEAYGYTYIRFLVHAFMLYLGLMLVVAACRIRFPGLPLAKWYIVISLVAYVIVNYAGMDRIIAEKNIERYRESGKIDVPYLHGLSTDAVPVLIRFSKSEYPALKSDLRNKELELSQTDRPWPSFNWSRWRAETALNRYLME